MGTSKSAWPMLEFWRAGGAESSTSAGDAQRIEAQGWDGQMFMDSQCLSCDPWVMMGAWAIATDQLKLCTGVTNSLTRHAAVTAACAASVQAISAGRAVLGIGRGDSALAYLGYAPDRVQHFENTLRELQGLLRGDGVDFCQQASDLATERIDALPLGDAPAHSRLRWLPEGLPKVPLDVAATGPKVIAAAAPVAERLTFSVGAIPERMQWAMDLANSARAVRGIVERGSYGAQIIVVCHPDRDAVMQAATSFVAPLARFQVLQGSAFGPQTSEDRTNFSALLSYDMNRHGRPIDKDKLKDAALTEGFVQRFAIIGPPDYCTARLLELVDLGIERFVIVGPGYHPEAYAGKAGLFVSEVMPAVRREVASRQHHATRSDYINQ